MKLYVEINGEKHYIDEGVVKRNALYEGMITPFTGLEIKKEGDTEVVTKEAKETETSLPTAIDDSETNTDINEVTGTEELKDVVEPIPESATESDESPVEAKELDNETLPIHITEDMGSQESSTTEVTEPVTPV
jgi:hypothetical protein